MRENTLNGLDLPRLKAVESLSLRVRRDEGVSDAQVCPTADVRTWATLVAERARGTGSPAKAVSEKLAARLSGMGMPLLRKWKSWPLHV